MSCVIPRLGYPRSVTCFARYPSRSAYVQDRISRNTTSFASAADAYVLWRKKTKGDRKPEGLALRLKRFFVSPGHFPIHHPSLVSSALFVRSPYQRLVPTHLYMRKISQSILRRSLLLLLPSRRIILPFRRKSLVIRLVPSVMEGPGRVSLCPPLPSFLAFFLLGAHQRT